MKRKEENFKINLRKNNQKIELRWMKRDLNIERIIRRVLAIKGKDAMLSSREKEENESVGDLHEKKGNSLLL